MAKKFGSRLGYVLQYHTGVQLLNKKLGESVAESVLLNHCNFLGPYLEDPAHTINKLDFLLGQMNNAAIVLGFIQNGFLSET